MALTQTEKTLRTLGQIVQSLWPDGDAPLSIHGVACEQPATAAGILRRQAGQKPESADRSYLLSQLPADICDPPDGVPVESQGPYWLGYYQYLSAIDRAAEYTSDDFAAIGKALYGDNWVAPLATELGVDKRRLREWRAGRAMPAPIWAELAVLLVQRGQRIEQLLEKLNG